MRRHVTYANVAATLALVFSMTGGALAARHYLISSTKQISPKVLKRLKGAAGRPGANGKDGAQGKEGPRGLEGKPGERGPSEAFAGKAESVSFPGSANAAEVVASVELAPGSYTIVATVDANNEGIAATEVQCVLLEQPTGGGNAVFDEALAKMETTGKVGDTANLALSGARVVATEAKLSVACKTPSTLGAYVAPRLTATKLGTLSGG